MMKIIFILFQINFLLLRYQQEDNEWSLLLKRQEEYYQTQITSLHTVLTTTHNALRNVRC